MNAIVIVVDGLHLGYLGPYGNTWIRTPAIDRLAAEGFVFDRAFIECPELDRLYGAYWLGRHAACSPRADDAASSLPALLAARSVPTILLTDDRLLAESGLAAGFSQTVALNLPESDRAAESVEQTRMARCCAELIDIAERARGPFLLWCHFRGLCAAWDAPRDFRLAYCDEEAPAPFEEVDVADSMLAAGYDSDRLLGWRHAHAAQVSLWDRCLAVVLEALAECPAGPETLVVLTSSRGFPMGEHRRVGFCDAALYSELVHVPLIVRFPDRQGETERSQAIVQAADLSPTLLDWFGVPHEAAPHATSLLPLVWGDAEAGRDRALIVGRGSERAIVTPVWYLRGGASAELYLLPGDRWEANDVADRCPDVVDALETVLHQTEQLIQNRQNPASCALAPLLVTAPE